jgi:peptidoglycan/LPS O-acetylase OafA/YrhL
VRREIRPLTGIRGVAALLVAAYHLNGIDAPPALRVEGLMGNLVNHGYLAVDLFFVLSGYVMALSYGEMLRVWSGTGFLRFLIRRIARVYPLYALITLVIAVLLATGVSHQDLPDLGPSMVWNLLMMQGWGFAQSLDGPSWSISTEWGAYLLFPLLASLTLYGRRITVLGAALISVLTVVVLVVLPFGGRGPLDVYGPGSALARCLAEFSMGLIAFRLAQHPNVQIWARRPLSTLIRNYGDVLRCRNFVAW